MNPQTVSKLQHRLFSTSLYIQRRGGVERTTVTGRQSFWVISRSCCIYRRIDFSHVPVAKRRAALQQRIPLDSPFSQSGFWVDWQNGIANLWLWDQERQDSLKSQIQDASDKTMKYFPESAYTEKIQQGGQLWQSSEGFIGQYWLDHLLLGESWWPEFPSTAQWHDFLKALAQRSDDVPEPRLLEMDSGVRWKNSQFGQISMASERAIMMSVAALFALIVTFQLTGISRLTINNVALNSDIQTLESEIEKTIELRDRFFILRNQNLQYASLSGLRQLEMMADVADVLGGMKATLAEWRYQDKTLEMIVTDNSPDLNRYVQQLEALGWLTGIRIDKSANKTQIVIRSELLESL